MDTKETAVILSTYTAQQWMNWIEDLLHVGVAYPFSYFSPDDEPADVLSKLVNYLQENDINTRPYEEAVNELLYKYQKEQYNAIKLHALLSAAMRTGSTVCKTSVLRLFDSRRLAPLEHKGYSLHTIALQALSKMNLSDAEHRKVRASIHALLHEIAPRPDIYAQSLYFARQKDDLDHPLADFFDWLYLMLQQLGLPDNHDADQLCATALRAEILGPAVSRSGDFFREFYHWYLIHDKILKFNAAYQFIISGLIQWFEQKPVRWQANEYANKLLFLMLTNTLLPLKSTDNQKGGWMIQVPGYIMEFLLESRQMKVNKKGQPEGSNAEQINAGDIYWYTPSNDNDYIRLCNQRRCIKIFDDVIVRFFCNAETAVSPLETLNTLTPVGLNAA